MKIRIVQIKVYPVKEDLEANHQRLLGVLAEVQAHQPDVVITPECFLDGYVASLASVTRENFRKYAIEPANSGYVRDVSSWAARQRTWFILGCSRRVAGGVSNCALIVDREGRLAGIYDKTHLLEQDLKYVPGQALPVFDSDFGRFGVLICADRRWPEAVRTLALKGARVIFIPTYGMHDERNLHMMQTRAYESEIYIAFTDPGQALVTGPEGEVVCNEVSEAVDYCVTEIDLSLVDVRRSAADAHLAHRRADLYYR